MLEELLRKLLMYKQMPQPRPVDMGSQPQAPFMAQDRPPINKRNLEWQMKRLQDREKVWEDYYNHPENQAKTPEERRQMMLQHEYNQYNKRMDDLNKQLIRM